MAWLRKPRTWAWLAGVFILLVVGIAGLTGVLLRHQLAPLQSAPLVLENGARLQVDELHGGWFTTQAILRLEQALGSGEPLIGDRNDLGAQARVGQVDEFLEGYGVCFHFFLSALNGWLGMFARPWVRAAFMSALGPRSLKLQ